MTEETAQKPPRRAAEAKQRARATNAARKGLLAVQNAPARSAVARRLGDLYQETISDLGGEAAGLSEGQRQIARRIATIAACCEGLEAAYVSTGELDVQVYTLLANAQNRLLRTIGIERRQRDVTGNALDRYIAAKRAAEAAGKAQEDTE
jgi:hypothetical protein